MKIENVRDVKMQLNRIIKDLPKTGSVVITTNGRPSAVLLPVSEETDFEVLALSHNERFWRMFDAAIARGEKEGWSGLEDLSD
ncbi:MAG: type II toxin-antitoxin system Phd/YefM family antitoxin [Deltaproteobacteria bacterium]|nr:type II toxin-antitoxin system Phd/YefM family antitoxin [Deltaproteobacteria bacterium]MBV8452327.1 type II toxin-antitoxin system Phd/YefM family antitoxin [Deltaproteobacteria bacterium]